MLSSLLTVNFKEWNVEIDEGTTNLLRKIDVFEE
jgi:hypothetical protein